MCPFRGRMKLFRIVSALVCLVFVSGVSPASDSSCGLFSCPYSCDLMLRYLKLSLKDSEVDSLTFLNLTPFADGGQRSDINDHSSVCVCDGFLDQHHLSNEDLETFDFSKGTEADQKCFIMTHDESSEDEEEFMKTGDGIFVILLLVVVAFLLWIIAVVSVTWYAHCKRVSRQTFSDENQNLMSRESYAIHTTGAAAINDRRTNHSTVIANPENEEPSIRDVAVITLYSSLPSMPGTRLVT